MAKYLKRAVPTKKKTTIPYGRLVVVNSKKGKVRANLISKDGMVLPVTIVGFSPDEGNKERTRALRRGVVYTYLAIVNSAVSKDGIIPIRSRKRLNFECDEGNKEKRKIVIGGKR